MSQRHLLENCWLVYHLSCPWFWKSCLEGACLHTFLCTYLVHYRFCVALCSSVLSYSCVEWTWRYNSVGHTIRNQISTVRCCLSFVVGDFVDGMTESCVNRFADRVACNQVITHSQVDRHFSGFLFLYKFFAQCERKQKSSKNHKCNASHNDKI